LEVAAYQSCSKQLEAKDALLESEEKALEAAREQLSSMKWVKEQIDLKIARLEAEVQTLKLAQNRSTNCQPDNSRLARIESMLSDAHDQVQIGMKTIDYAKNFDFE